mmetsp:Transcript_128029/g.292536  ORF Transcript_128029/g.292536 Transcript_128029/m.292536 type:complete len:338 (+) Transcript_128029:501-1514(+)
MCSRICRRISASTALTKPSFSAISATEREALPCRTTIIRIRTVRSKAWSTVPSGMTHTAAGIQVQGSRWGVSIGAPHIQCEESQTGWTRPTRSSSSSAAPSTTAIHSSPGGGAHGRKQGTSRAPGSGGPRDHPSSEVGALRGVLGGTALDSSPCFEGLPRAGVSCDAWLPRAGVSCDAWVARAQAAGPASPSRSASPVSPSGPASPPSSSGSAGPASPAGQTSFKSTPSGHTNSASPSTWAFDPLPTGAGRLGGRRLFFGRNTTCATRAMVAASLTQKLAAIFGRQTRQPVWVGRRTITRSSSRARNSSVKQRDGVTWDCGRPMELWGCLRRQLMTR